MKFRSLLPIAVGALLLAAGCERSIAPEDSPQEPAAKNTAGHGDVVPGRYIVVLNDDVASSRVPEVASDMARAHAAQIDFTYTEALRGFAARMSAQDAASLANDPRVDFIEPDRAVMLSPKEGEAEKRPGSGGSGGGGQTTPWGITYVGGPGTASVHAVWIIDTGLDLDHPDLNVDRNRSRNFVGRGKNTPDDGNGHGTHVGGTVGARNNTTGVIGVAPGVPLVAVRVLDNNGMGYYSEIIAGVNYVATTATSGDVANMSLGGPASTALDNAVIALASKGVSVALAAGNDGVDAATQSPARVNNANVYTVSAIGSNGCLTWWSNYGATTVDYAAPGLSILSTWKGGGTKTISGTSMAAPHVAGLLAIGSLNSLGTACGDPDGVADPKAHK